MWVNIYFYCILLVLTQDTLFSFGIGYPVRFVEEVGWWVKKLRTISEMAREVWQNGFLWFAALFLCIEKLSTCLSDKIKDKNVCVYVEKSDYSTENKELLGCQTVPLGHGAPLSLLAKMERSDFWCYLIVVNSNYLVLCALFYPYEKNIFVTYRDKYFCQHNENSINNIDKHFNGYKYSFFHCVIRKLLIW